jgi:hypothetical protein
MDCAQWGFPFFVKPGQTGYPEKRARFLPYLETGAAATAQNTLFCAVGVEKKS